RVLSRSSMCVCVCVVVCYLPCVLRIVTHVSLFAVYSSYTLLCLHFEGLLFCLSLFLSFTFVFFSFYSSLSLTAFFISAPLLSLPPLFSLSPFHTHISYSPPLHLFFVLSLCIPLSLALSR